MALRTGDQFRKHLGKSKRDIYIAGTHARNAEKHPVTGSAVRAVARMFDAALESGYAPILSGPSVLVNATVSRALHVPASVDDLEQSARMARLTARLTGVCSYRSGGGDALSALHATTWEMDRSLGTAYHGRFVEYLKAVQSRDLFVTGAMAGPTGDPRRRPPRQADPDLTLRAVEKRPEGVVLQGAKMHQSGAYAADEILVIPGLELEPGEDAYAVACAVDGASPGLRFICQYSPLSAERAAADSPAELGNPLYGARETCLVVFDHVFVPWDRVFMFGETEFSGRLVRRFSRAHRIGSGAACTLGYGDLILGAAHWLAEAAGSLDAPGTVHRLAEMARLQKTTEGCVIAATLKGEEEPAGSGVYFPDGALSDAANLTGAEGVRHLIEHAIAIGGALLVTLPSERELANPVTRADMEKFLAGAGETPVSDRMRMTRFLQTWVAGLRTAEVYHGAGSPESQRRSLFDSGEWRELRGLAARLAGLEEP